MRYFVTVVSKLFNLVTVVSKLQIPFFSFHSELLKFLDYEPNLPNRCYSTYLLNTFDECKPLTFVKFYEIGRLPTILNQL